MIVCCGKLTMTFLEPDAGHACLRRGHQCNCKQCEPWIAKWSKELDAFTCVDTMMRDGRSLLRIHERLAAEYPDTLQIHADFIEKQCIECKMDNTSLRYVL